MQASKHHHPLIEQAVRSLSPLIQGEPSDDDGINLAQPSGPLASLWAVPEESVGARAGAPDAALLSVLFWWR